MKVAEYYECDICGKECTNDRVILPAVTERRLFGHTTTLNEQKDICNNCFGKIKSTLEKDLAPAPSTI
jgi:hypothetical protein